MSLGLAAWWLCSLLLAPLLLPLAWLTRRRALCLPVAGGEPQGLVEGGGGEPLRLLVLGESPVAGVGVARHSEALAAQLAACLAQGLRRPVSWQALGENGIRAEQACQRLLPGMPAQPVDILLLVFGVNDTTHPGSLRRWLAAMRQLAEQGEQQGALVAISAVPPLQHFSALPWLLRQWLGWRGWLLDRGLRGLAQRHGWLHCAVALGFSADYLARDGYHPSALGYRQWARGLAPLLIERLR